MLSPGDRVKDYEVIAPLRSGGMAMLYLARRRGVGGFSRLVALKLVHPQLMRDETITRLFLDEARLSANVVHPNVVNVEEIGTIRGSYFMAMEYVHGVSLSELLASLSARRMRMTPKLCVWLAAQVAEALHAAHEAKADDGRPLEIVHRDVSPQNVLIAHTGYVKLIDFGIANSPSSHSGGPKRAVLGKLGYMAPEQLRLESADRRSDLYALGVMLWEMLAARPLFRSRRIDDERDWATRENPPAPSAYAAHLGPELDRVVRKAICFAPEERYPSALELRAALLRADPAAAKVDAPTFAALLHSLLGDELERLRASLPSEVSIQLGLDVDLTPTRVVELEQLTAEVLPAEGARVQAPPDEVRGKASSLPGEPEEDEVEDTLAESPHSRRARRSDAGALAGDSRPISIQLLSEQLARCTSVIYTSAEAQIITMPSPPSVARRLPIPRAILRAARDRKVHVMLLSSLCLIVGVWLGSRVTLENARARRTPPATTTTASRPAADGRAWTSRVEREPRSVADGGPLALRGAAQERDGTRLTRPQKATQRREVREAKRAASSKARNARHTNKAARLKRRGH